MPTEETLVLVKPDGVARGLTGAILARIEAKGYALVDIKLVEPDRDLLEQHYAEHAGKPFYEPLLEFMMSGPSVAIRLAGNRVIEGFRSLAGLGIVTGIGGGTAPVIALPPAVSDDEDRGSNRSAITRLPGFSAERARPATGEGLSEHAASKEASRIMAARPRSPLRNQRAMAA